MFRFRFPGALNISFQNTIQIHPSKGGQYDNILSLFSDWEESNNVYIYIYIKKNRSHNA